MPRIPKTLPAQLRQYYRTAPRPASEFEDDVFNFAADSLGRRNRAMQDLEDLDRYAMEQQARGRYRPDELNALAQQIEADRMLSEMDFNEFMRPRYKRYRDYAESEAYRIHDMANEGLERTLQNRFIPSEELTPYYTGVGDEWLDTYIESGDPRSFVEWENANLAPVNYKRYRASGYDDIDPRPEASDIQPMESWLQRFRWFRGPGLDNRDMSPEIWRESLGNKRYR